MLTREKIINIKQLHRRGASLRDIERKTGHCFRTIRRYVSQDKGQSASISKTSRTSKLDRYEHEILKEWKRGLSWGKQKYTARSLWQEIMRRHKELKVSESAFSRWLRRHNVRKQAAFIPLIHDYSEAQVDFGEFWNFDKRGKKEKMNHLVLSFPHSNARYYQVFKGQNQECLFAGLNAIFKHIGGIPRNIVFDNMSTAVSKVGKKRTLTQRFKEYAAHCGFEPIFCNPASGNEKGNVEAAVGFLRRRFLSPPPIITDIDAFNKQALCQCDALLDNIHYRHQEPIKDIHQKEKDALIPLPSADFDHRRWLLHKTDKYGCVQFETNRYTVGGAHAQCEVWISVGAHDIEVYNAEKTSRLIVHKRLYTRHNLSRAMDGYVEVLAKKPRAITQSGAIPDANGEFLNALKKMRVCDRESTIRTAIEHGVDHALNPQKVPAFSNVIRLPIQSEYRVDSSKYSLKRK